MVDFSKIDLEINCFCFLFLCFNIIILRFFVFKLFSINIKYLDIFSIE